MFIENNLSEADMLRAHDAATAKTPAILSGSYLATLEAIDLFTQQMVHPITTGLAKSERQTIIVGLYYRIIGFCRTAIKLNSVIHQQSLTSAERSCVEIYVDLELLHRNAVENAVAKFSAFTDWQRLRAAKRIDTFFAKNPDLDTTPSKAEPHRGLIKARGKQIEATVLDLWGTNKKGEPIRPEHWSNKNLPDRAALLDKDVELLVVEFYDMRNFSIHSGLAGIANLDKVAFEYLCMQSLNIIGTCVLGALRILGKEIDIYKQISEFDEILNTLSTVQVYAFADKLLQSLGEPQRYFLHPGEPGPDLVATDKAEKL
jgi:hypothetical protein